MQTTETLENQDVHADCPQAVTTESSKTTYLKSLKAKLESGATAIEYALMASLIAVAIITAVTTLGTGVGATFDEVSAQLS